MSGSLLRKPALTSTPPPSMSSPADSATSRLGTAPAAISTVSAAMVSPSARRNPVAAPFSVVISATLTSVRRSTPCSRCRSAKTWATSGPSARSSGSFDASAIATSTPRSRADAATSMPIQPAPTIARRDPSVSVSRIARASSTVRR
ncbi:Uncharacterised protein [Mycobacteroides abscessus subsp. abscessus]|nr:Uncharacterised protein [Mycobacteroides abscessus subsp. abscessus]